MIPSGFFAAPNAQQQPGQNPGASTSGDQSAQPSTSTAGETMMPPFGFMPPPMPPFMSSTPPFMLPFPPAPSFNGLSDDEVRRMEGNERRAVEARIQCLRNIQTLLDAAVVQLQQYTSILATLSASPHFRDAFSAAPSNATANSSTSADVHFNLGANDADDGPSPSSSGTNLRNAAESSTDGPSTSTDPQDEVRLRRLHHFEKKREGSNNSN